MRPPASQQPSKNQYPGRIVIFGLFSGILITSLIWLKLPNQWIHSLSLFSLGLIGLWSFLFSRKPFSPRRRSLVILSALAAVSLVYLFPEMFGPACGGMPRAFASPAPACGRCIDFVCEWNDKKNQEHCYCNEWDDSDCTVDQPPRIEAELSCGSWGLNNWCTSPYTLHVTAVEPQGLKVMIAGDILGTEFACPATLATSTCSAPLPQGKGTVTFTATSINGLTASGSALFKRDTLKPQIASELYGTSGNNGWYISALKVSASATDPTPGSGLEAFTYNLDGAGWRTYAGPLTLSDGVHSLNLRASDRAGKVATLNHAIQIDTITPTLNLFLEGTAGTNGWYRSNLQLAATASDAGSGLSAFEYDIDGAGWTAYTSPLQMSDGVHNVSMRVLDSAGNNTNWTQSFYIDTIAPVLNPTVAGISGANGWYTSPLQLTLTASDPEASSAVASGVGAVEYNLDGAGWATYNAPLELGDGVHSLELRGSDLAGNLTSGNQTFLVDTLPPTVDVNLSGTQGAHSWYLSVVQVEAVASDTGSALSTLEVQVDGGDWNPYNAPMAFGDGSHSYRFRASDHAGNLTEISLQEFHVDTIPPAISLPALWELGESASFELLDNGSGLASVRLVIEDEAGRYPKVTTDDALAGISFTGQINWNGRFEDGTLATFGGKYYATLIVTDNAGNESRATGQIKVPLIFIAPTSTSSSTPTPTSLASPTSTGPAQSTPTARANPTATGTSTDEPSKTGEKSPTAPWLPTVKPSGTPTHSLAAGSTPTLVGIVSGDSTGTPSNQTLLTVGGGNNDTAKPSEVQTFKTDNADTSSQSSDSSNVLWAATATAAVGAFTAEILRRKQKQEAKEHERIAKLEKAAERRENSNYSQKIKNQKKAELEAKWEAERELAEQRNLQRQLNASDSRVTRKEAAVEAEMSSYTKDAQELGPAYYSYIAQKTYERFREQERETPEAIEPQNEKKSIKSWLEKKILETALSLNLDRYSEELEVIEDSLISIGDIDRNPRIAAAHEQTWAAIEAWEAIFQMRTETKEFTTEAFKDGRWGDAFRGVSALVKQNLTVSAGAVAAGAIAAWGVVTTPVRIFTQDIPEFNEAGQERMEGKDRFWDVLFTGTNLAGDVTALYGGYQLAGRMNVTNKINSAARDQFGIGPKVIERVYTYKGTEYVYKYDPCKKAALGYLEDLQQLTPEDYNILKGVPKDIYSKTNIQSDFLRDIANSKVKPSYFSDPRLNSKRVFSRTEHRFLTKLKGMFPGWWNSSGTPVESIFNGSLSEAKEIQ